MENLRLEKKKGIKATLIDMKTGNENVFPRAKYSSIRNSMSTLKIEHPERSYYLEVIENGIKVTCLK